MYVTYIVYAATMFLAIICFIMMQMWRFDNAGRVCSGEYLEEGQDEKGYLINEGKFIKWVIITFYIMFAIVLLSILIIALVFVQ